MFGLLQSFSVTLTLQALKTPRSHSRTSRGNSMLAEVVTCRLLAFGSLVGLLLGIAASNVLSAIVYHATPKDPFVMAGVVLAMALLGLLATWIPAQRTLSIDPLILLREE